MKEIVAVLHNIRSVHNVGSMFRTADGAGVRKIYLCGITPSPVDRFGNFVPQFTKVSLGAERHLEWEKVVRPSLSRAESALRVIERLKKEGFKICAVEQARNSVLYHRANVRGRAPKIALVVGSEVGGLPQSILKRADEILEIPMRGALVRHVRHPRRTRRGKESLNVAVAFGIAAYSVAR